MKTLDERAATSDIDATLPSSMDESDRALVKLGQALRMERYEFVSVTPETMRRVQERRARSTGDRAQCLRDVFGWNRAFLPESLPSTLLDLLKRADQVEEEGGWLRSRVRFATLRGELFAHSAYPTTAADSVFFGPDTQRFCALLQRWAPRRVAHLVDVGAGSGAGGITLAKRAERVVLADINPRATSFARVNAALAAVNAEVVESDLFESVEGAPDLVIANPPYLLDVLGRVYRDGGGTRGEGFSVRVVDAAMHRLARGGSLIVYTGTAVVDGVNVFLRQLAPVLEEHRVRVRGTDFAYEEIDPDVFGEELDQPGYADADRIAVVGIRVQKR